MTNNPTRDPADVAVPDFDEDAAIARARARSAQFHDTYIKPTARESAGTLMEKPIGCQCPVPLPKLAAAGCFACTRCGEPLRVDAEGSPFRRLPGDLDTQDQRNARQVLEVANMSKEEMRPLVDKLPHHLQLKLSKLRPKRFLKVARQMIRTHMAVQASEGKVEPGPNARRRIVRRNLELADVVDDIAELARKRRDGEC